MNESASSETRGPSFTSKSEYHRPTVRRSLFLVVPGLPLFLAGLYAVINDLPTSSSNRTQSTLSALPTAVGGFMLAFGIYGLVVGVLGMLRKGDEAIDLAFRDQGVVVRGGHVIPWGSIWFATSVQYINESKIPLLWRSEDLNRALVLRLKEPLDVPGAASKDGKHTVRIRLQRYPAVEYQKTFKEVIAKLRARKIQVLETKKHKQT